MKINLSLIACLLFLGACGLFDDPTPEVILNVDTEFEVRLLEILDTDRRELGIEITSLDKLDCQETALDLKHQLVGNEININIKDITMPLSCDGVTSYPTGLAAFDVGFNNYNLGLQVKEQPNQVASLSVTGDSYIMDLVNTKGFITEHPELMRIPSNFTWGYYQARNQNEIALFETFLADNNLAVRPFQYLTPGYYSYFEIDEEGYVDIMDLPKEGIVKALAFDLNTLSEIKEAVAEFKSTNPELTLILNGSDGSQF